MLQTLAEALQDSGLIYDLLDSYQCSMEEAEDIINLI